MINDLTLENEYHLDVGSGWDCWLYANDFLWRPSVSRVTCCCAAGRSARARELHSLGHNSWSEAVLSNALKVKQRRSVSCCEREGQGGWSENCAHPFNFDIGRSLLRPYLPDVGSGWDCWLYANDFLWRPSVSRVTCCCTAERGARARELHSLGHNSWSEAVLSNVPKSGNVSAVTTILCWSCLEIFTFDTYSRPEVAFPNTFPWANVLIVEQNTALELLSPQTHFAVRGSILQRVLDWERPNMNFNIVLELGFPLTHSTSKGSILQYFLSGQ